MKEDLLRRTESHEAGQETEIETKKVIGINEGDNVQI